MPPKGPELNADRATFSADPKIMKLARSKARERHQKFSTYIAQLVEADVLGESSADRVTSGAKALVQLGEMLPGQPVERLAQYAAAKRPFAEFAVEFAGKDPLFLATTRRAYDFLLGSHYPDPAEMARWERISDERILKTATTLATVLNEQGARALLELGKEVFALAGEQEQAPYGSPKKTAAKGHAGPTAHLPKPGDKPQHGSAASA